MVKNFANFVASSWNYIIDGGKVEGILMLENEKENERLKKALINAYKALERKYLENLEEIDKISSKLGSLN